MNRKKIEFAEAKKAPKRLQRTTRLDNQAIKKLQKTMASGLIRKAKVWEQEGRTGEYAKQKIQVWGEKLIAKKKTIAEKNRLHLANKKIDRTVDSFNKAVQAPPNTINQPKSLNQVLLDEGIDVSKMERAPKKPMETVIKPRGNGKGLLIGAGIATGAAVLSGIGYGLYRKKRSDKGKKRGKYNTFNSSTNYAEFGYRKKIKDPDKFFKKVGKKNKTVKDPNAFFQKLGKKYT
jgi:hypothetical protein